MVESREGEEAGSVSSWAGLEGSVGLGVGGLEKILERRADFLGLFWGSWEREEVEVEAIDFQAAWEVEDRAGAEIRTGSSSALRLSTLATMVSLARPVREMAELPGWEDCRSREPWTGLGEEPENLLCSALGEPIL